MFKTKTAIKKINKKVRTRYVIAYQKMQQFYKTKKQRHSISNFLLKKTKESTV